MPDLVKFFSEKSRIFSKLNSVRRLRSGVLSVPEKVSLGPISIPRDRTVLLSVAGIVVSIVIIACNVYLFIVIIIIASSDIFIVIIITANIYVFIFIIIPFLLPSSSSLLLLVLLPSS